MPDEQPVIAGLMAVADFPLDLLKLSVEGLSSLCDYIHVRLDNIKSVDPVWFNQYQKVTKIWRSSENWNRNNWQEELVRSLDDLKPDIVIMGCQDEVLEDGMAQELREFWNSDKKIMFVDYARPMPTCDGRIAINGRPYPTYAHALVYKWQPGLGFNPYCGMSQPTQLSMPGCAGVRWDAKTRVKHYCMWTPEMEASKREWVTKEYGPNEFG